MIVQTTPAGLRCVTQPDHAAFAADLLATWRLPDVAAHPRRRGLLAAVRHHDNGWRELDAAPRVDPESGRPYTFLDLPAALRQEVWERGTARYATSEPYVALLVTWHALALRRGGEPDDEEETDFRRRLAERRDELLERVGLAAGEVATDYGWLALADSLSLAVCAGWRDPWSGGGVTARAQGDELALTPFPLAGTTRVALACRTIPDRRYAGDADLVATLAAARWERREVRVLPG